MILLSKFNQTIGKSTTKVNDMDTDTDKVTDAQTAMFSEQLLSHDHIAQMGIDYVLTIQEAHR